MSISCQWNGINRTSALPSSITDVSFTGWFYFLSTLPSYPMFFRAQNSGHSDWIEAYRPNADGCNFYHEGYSGAELSSPTWALNTWYFVAGSFSDSNNPGTIGAIQAVGGTLYTADSGGTEATNTLTTPTEIVTADDADNLLVAGFKLWDTQLSLEELLRERWTLQPKECGNLYLWWPCIGGSISEARKDRSGSGRDASNGTSYDDRMPPVGWGGYPIILNEPAGESASASASLSPSSSLSPSASPSPSIAPEDAIAWGEEIPDGEEAKSWQYWEVSAGVGITVQGDADWGKAEVADGTPVYGDVVNIGDSNTRTYTVTRDKYGSGSGNVSLYIRGDTTPFTQHAGTPSWNLYSTPTEQDWQYVQLRIDYSS